jgi:hypothetical protein
LVWFELLCWNGKSGVAELLGLGLGVKIGPPP